MNKNFLDSAIIQNWQTNKGARIYFIERHEAPFVDITVIFNAGSLYDEKKYGISQLTNIILPRGTQNFDLHHIALGFEEVGAQFSKTSNRDISSFSLRSLTKAKNLNKSLEIFTDIITKPIFPEAEFFRLKKLTLNAINYQEQRPSLLAKNAFFKSAYDKHPYSHSVLGSIESVALLNEQDLTHFYHKFYSLNNMIITIVGDLTLPKAQQIANKITADMQLTQMNDDVIDAIHSSAMCQKIQFPSKQTHILIGQSGIHFNSNYFPILVGNQILGGSVSSRLHKIIRDKYGLAYTIGSHVSLLKASGPFIVMLQTRNRRAAKAIKLVLETLDKFITNGPTHSELKTIKNQIINGFPFSFASNHDIAMLLQKMAVYNLPMDYLTTFCDQIAKVTRTQIKNAFQESLPIENMVKIVVGDISDM